MDCLHDGSLCHGMGIYLASNYEITFKYINSVNHYGLLGLQILPTWTLVFQFWKNFMRKFQISISFSFQKSLKEQANLSSTQVYTVEEQQAILTKPKKKNHE